MNVMMAGTTFRQLLLRKTAITEPHLGKLRSFQTSALKQFEYSNDYIHAPTMYNLTAMKNRRLKFGMLVFGGIAVASAIPIVAVQFQQRKAGGT